MEAREEWDTRLRNAADSVNEGKATRTQNTGEDRRGSSDNVHNQRRKKVGPLRTRYRKTQVINSLGLTSFLQAKSRKIKDAKRGLKERTLRENGKRAIGIQGDRKCRPLPRREGQMVKPGTSLCHFGTKDTRHTGEKELLAETRIDGVDSVVLNPHRKDYGKNRPSQNWT